MNNKKQEVRFTLLAVFLALLGILLYISFPFTVAVEQPLKMKFAFLTHDLAKMTAESQPSPVKETTTIQPTLVATPTSLPLSTEESFSLEKLYQTVNPSVVNIEVTVILTPVGQKEHLAEILPNPYSLSPDIVPLPPTPEYAEMSGSGFVWDQTGHVVTNNHVVEKADSIKVVFANGVSVPGKVVGTDVNSDLAVIQIDLNAAPDLELKPIELGDSKDLLVGQKAYAIGNPFGLSGTMTEGIVSALARSLPVADQTNSKQTYSIPDIIQTDAAINPGNSGGVLLNEKGKVIGVTAAIESAVNSNAGVGFAIPIDLVKKVVPALIEKGTYDYPYLGLAGISLNSDLVTAMNLPKGQTGVLVLDVTPDGPSARAGVLGGKEERFIGFQRYLLGGDVLIQIEDQEVKRFEDVVSYLSQHTTVEQTVNLKVLRNREVITIPVQLEKRPATNQVAAAPETKTGISLGIQGTELTPVIAEKMGIAPNQQGVLLVTVPKKSVLGKAGIRGSQKKVVIEGEKYPLFGDVLVGWNLQAITSMADLQQVLQLYEPGEAALLTILRDGQEFSVQVEFE